MKRGFWHRSTAGVLIGIFFLAPAHAQELTPVRITNKAGLLWIWVEINGKKTFRVRHAIKINLTVPSTVSMKVYMKDPGRMTEYQLYEIPLDNVGLSNVKHGFEIRGNYLIYRYVGREGMKEQKLKRRLWPIKKNMHKKEVVRRYTQ